MTTEPPLFIVAEISKNWIRGPETWMPLSQGEPIQALFERVIAMNWDRRYALHSFRLDRFMVTPDEMNETIIAVFQHRDLKR